MAYLILLISGFSSLYYEFLALKECELNLGISTFAVSSVLLTFLTGIFIGNILAGQTIKKRSDQGLKNTLIVIEILIVPIALLTPWLIKLTGQFYASNIAMELPLTLRLLIRYFLILPALLPIGLLTGIRFPLYLKIFNRKDQIAILYAFSCFGSAAGALAGGFFMFEYLGVYNSLITVIAVAAPANIILLMLWSQNRSELLKKSVPSKESRKLFFNKPALKILLLFFLLGLATIALEILWVRSLIRSFPNHRYIFSIISSVLLVSMFIGSLSSKFIKPVKSAIIFSLLALGISCQLGIGIQGKFNFFDMFGRSENLPLFIINMIAATIIIIGIPGVILGLLFPLTFNYALKNNYIDKARLTFLSVSVNSAGAIFGALLFGFLFMHLWGYKVIFTALSAFFLCISLFFIIKKRSLLQISIYIAGLLLFVYSSWIFLTDKPIKDYYLLTEMIGSDADVRIYERKNFDTPNRILMLNQAFISGGSGYLAERIQRKQSLIPLLLSQKEQRALTISLATGITASTFVEAGIKQVECIELLPSSIKLSNYFKRQNGNILEQKNFKLIIGDGRLFIKRSKAEYDIILSDNYQYSSAATPVMYALETFLSIKQAMSNDAVFVQWLPLKQIPPEHLKIIINTFRQVFPKGELYFDDISRNSSLLGIIAYKNQQTSSSKINSNYKKFKNLCQKSLFDNHTLSTYYIGTVEQFCKLYPVQEINTHESPVLERYFTPRAFNQNNFSDLEVLYRQNNVSDINNNIRRELFLKVGKILKEQGRKNHFEAFKLLQKILQSKNLNNPRINTFFPEISFLKGELATAVAANYFAARNISYANAYLNIAKASLFRSARLYRLNGILDGVYGRPELAEESFNKALELEPDDLRVYESKALIYLNYGKEKQALTAIKRALNAPYPDPVILRTALIIYMKLDRYEQFIKTLEQYISLPNAGTNIFPRVIDYLKRKGNTQLIQKLNLKSN
jgi:spermidine synthase